MHVYVYNCKRWIDGERDALFDIIFFFGMVHFPQGCSQIPTRERIRDTRFSFLFHLQSHNVPFPSTFKALIFLKNHKGFLRKMKETFFYYLYSQTQYYINILKILKLINNYLINSSFFTHNF